MKKTKKLLGLFVTSLVVVPLSGCNDSSDEVEVCYDLDYDLHCDDSRERVDADDYLVIDGRKTRIFIKDDTFYQDGLGVNDDYDGYGG